MALDEQMTKVLQRDIKDAETRPKKEILQEQVAGLKSTGKFIGETAVESIPGVSQAIGVKRTSDALEEDDYVGAGIEGTALAASVVPGIGPAVAKGLRKFNKTRKAYKLFVKGEDGELYPLFVDANKSVKQGKFLEANFPDVAFKGKRKEGSKESFYVPTKGAKRSKGEKAKGTGDSIIIPDETTRKKLIDEGFITEKTRRTKEAPFGRVTAVAARPGWHASQAPVATHLGPQDLKVTKKEAEKLVKAGVTPEAIKRRGNQFYVKRRAEDQVFAEVDMADDVDYQSMLAKEGRSDINDRVPKGGSYKYSDGQADSDQWVVGGDMKVNKVLSREETRAIQKEMGVVDLPYRDEVEAILEKKFAKGGVVMDDYLLGKIMDKPQNFAEGGVVPMNNMPKQMELFEEGGLMDEGGTVDPVSGNEVPVGSTQEEVRDDIPAQLSEGEFVLPADVVRYHGLDKIMALRDEAKAGLARMEAMGQMGNSEEAVIPDGIPFDIDDLDMEDEEEQGELNFAVGGNVSGTAFTPLPATATAAAPVAVGTAAAPVTAASSAYIPQLQGTKFTPSSTAPARSPTFYQTVGTPFIPQSPQTTTGTTTTAPATSTAASQSGGEGGGGDTFDGTAGPVTTGTVTGYTSPSATMSEVGGFLTKDIEANANAFGGSRAFGMSNAALRSATIDQAMYQLGSISPTGTIASTLAKEFGFTNATMNDMAVAGQQAKEAALTTLGFTRASQIQTSNQATMYGTMISAAHAAAKKGEDVTVALAKEMSNPAYAEVVKGAAVSAMQGLGYTSDQMSNPASVNSAIGGYRAAAEAYRADAAETQSSGIVRDSRGNAVKHGPIDPVTNKHTKDVMTQSARDRMNAELEAARTAEAQADAIAAEQARSRGNVARDDAVMGEVTNTDIANARAAAATAGYSNYGGYEDDEPGSNDSSGMDGTYICTASYANGLIAHDHFTSLKKYGIMLRRNDPYLMKAYDWFGPVLASKVKDGKLSTFAKHTTDLWKYNQTKHSDVSFNVKIMSQFHKAITRPVLRVLGRVLVIKEKIYK